MSLTLPGNSWGVDKNGTSCLGCGPQEQFYGCADVAIGNVTMNLTLRPFSSDQLGSKTEAVDKEPQRASKINYNNPNGETVPDRSDSRLNAGLPGPVTVSTVTQFQLIASSKVTADDVRVGDTRPTSDSASPAGRDDELHPKTATDPAVSYDVMPESGQQVADSSTNVATLMQLLAEMHKFKHKQ